MSTDATGQGAQTTQVAQAAPQTSNTPNAAKKRKAAQIVPVFIAFFIMAFVDLVGTATNYVKPEFGLSDTVANLFTTMVFFWFLLLSIPTGMVMNAIGRRRTVILSIWITVGSMIVPVIAYMATEGTLRFALIVVSFCLLGIGNALMQVALNPLMALFVTGERLAGMLSTGQFVRAIASLLAPYIAAWMLMEFGAWWGLFVVYLVVAVIGAVALEWDVIEEPAYASDGLSVRQTAQLLRHPAVLLGFLCIVAHVGIDVGLNAQLPRILRENTGIEISIATAATMVYFIGRMVGSFLGGIILPRISGRTALRICGGIMVTCVALFLVFTLTPLNPPVWVFWMATVLAGVGNVNVFGIVMSRLLNDMPERQNEVSGLMITGLIGGAIVPPLMGVASDALGQVGAILVVAVGVAYIVFLGARFELLEESEN
ncbi:MFS transporter [Alloscardovia macacae]|uniref:MFS transporter n=1 Tax=Alloscardovia macacae TaxID=1160091 RepID=A0A1Y2SUU0_9BIFI|nr:MFS transporter [Alloscardovia macacae]OTA26665.1 MFS transporter [Alloscardovia macacae]OTA29532.1 MFS transporter [Alloscardovia macacae]